MALPSLLDEGAQVRDQILKRIRSNRQTLETWSRAMDDVLSLHPAQGGWASILKIKKPKLDEEVYILDCMKAGVYVMPGYFFEMDEGVHFIVSLLVPENLFQQGLSLLETVLQK